MGGEYVSDFVLFIYLFIYSFIVFDFICFFGATSKDTSIMTTLLMSGCLRDGDPPTPKDFVISGNQK